MLDPKAFDALNSVAQAAWENGIKAASPFVGQGQGLEIQSLEPRIHLHYFLVAARSLGDEHQEAVKDLMASEADIAAALSPVLQDDTVVGFAPTSIHS